MSVFACSDADEQTVQKSKICGLSMWHWDDIDDVIITNNYIWHNLLCRLQLFNMAIKCGLGQSWKPKVKPNLVCYSNIAIGMPYISDCVSSWYPNIWRSYSRLSVLVTTYSYWPRGPWILICDFPALPRLSHAPQNRCGGDMCSLNDSCLLSRKRDDAYGFQYTHGAESNLFDTDCAIMKRGAMRLEQYFIILTCPSYYI